MRQVRMTLEGPFLPTQSSFKAYAGVLFSNFLLEDTIVARTSDLTLYMCQEGRTR